MGRKRTCWAAHLLRVPGLCGRGHAVALVFLVHGVARRGLIEADRRRAIDYAAVMSACG
jgi:hypothetical protein